MPPPALSPRQRAVLALLNEGLGRRRIAEELGISLHTLGGYVKEIYRHFGVQSQAELIASARRGSEEERT